MLQSSARDIPVDPLVESTCSTSQDPGSGPSTCNDTQCLEQLEKPVCPWSLDKTSTMLTLSMETMDMLISLVPASPERKFSSVTTVLPAGLEFPISPGILKQMLCWSGCLLPYLEQILNSEDGLKQALSPVYGPWPECYAELLCCVPVPSMVGCIQAHLSGSGFQVHVKKELLLTALTRAQEVAPAPAVAPDPPEELGLPPRAVPEPEPVEASAVAAAARAELEEAGPGDPHGASLCAEASRASEAAEVSRLELGSEQVSISTFPARLVAEQLTFMDAELFLELVPYHCRGAIWSKRKLQGYERACPTVRATKSQFITVATCVLTTCLGDLSLPARARMLEYWILVAQECQRLHNWASTNAILCALQIPAIRRLRQTWRQVSRRRQWKLRDLCRQAQRHKRCKPPKEEQGCSFTSWLRNLGGGQQRPLGQGVIPFLGPYLQKLEKLDQEMADFLGEKVNNKKFLKEKKILREIALLQEAAENHNLQPHEQFLTWFNDLELITEEESCVLSFQREPSTKPSNPRHRQERASGEASVYNGFDFPFTSFSS